MWRVDLRPSFLSERVCRSSWSLSSWSERKVVPGRGVIKEVDAEPRWGVWGPDGQWPASGWLGGVWWGVWPARLGGRGRGPTVFADHQMTHPADGTMLTCVEQHKSPTSSVFVGRTITTEIWSIYKTKLSSYNLRVRGIYKRVSGQIWSVWSYRIWYQELEKHSALRLHQGCSLPTSPFKTRVP